MPGTSTTKHIFNLHCLIENAKNKGDNLFCAFLDLSSAFDKVWREGMFLKLVNNNINGSFLRIVESMYNDTKAYVRYSKMNSETFVCDIGIKQGCNLSCLLFALYLNDLETFMNKDNCNGLSIYNSENGILFLKLLVLLYADDTVIMSTNYKDLKRSLNSFAKYCLKWHLKVNEEKSKVLIFGKDRSCYNFFMNGNLLEKVRTFKYLGFVFSKNCRYLEAMNHNKQQAKKAFFSILRISRELNLSPSCELHILNTVVKPILLYNLVVSVYLFIYLSVCKPVYGA